MRRQIIGSLVLACAFGQSPQNPSPMTEDTRPHPRIDETATSGRRVPLALGSILLPPKPRAVMPLVIHFHGAPWLAERSVRQRSQSAAVIAIQLGSGSGVYAGPLKEPGRFQALLAEARKAAHADFRPITLTSFSAGYGAIREILRDPANAKAVDAIVLMDSLHTGYTSGSTPGPLEEELLKPFLDFARQAVAGRKRMLITHSEVFPGTFASTTETADYILRQLRVKAPPVLKTGPIGMQQLSKVRVGKFELYGYAGNSAPDHVDHFQAMAEWLRRIHVN